MRSYDPFGAVAEGFPTLNRVWLPSAGEVGGVQKKGVCVQWIELRTGLHRHPKSARLCNECDLLPDQVVLYLYRLAEWFADHGKHGKMYCKVETIDHLLGRPGFAKALMAVDWLRAENGVLLLREFCSISATRKGLGALRSELKTNAKCAICEATDQLEIDHKTPISRGGSCARENLQVLCRTCNRAKGRMTMDEFMATRPF